MVIVPQVTLGTNVHVGGHWATCTWTLDSCANTSGHAAGGAKPPPADVCQTEFGVRCAPRAVQFHPDGGQFGFAHPSPLTHHGAYV